MKSVVLDAFSFFKKEIYTYIFPTDFPALVGMNMVLISGKWDSNLWPNNV